MSKFFYLIISFCCLSHGVWALAPQHHSLWSQEFRRYNMASALLEELPEPHTKIPSYIHHIWLQSSLPKEFRENLESFHCHNPRATQILWIDATRADCDAYEDYREMLDWAKQHHIIVLNVYDFFPDQPLSDAPHLRPMDLQDLFCYTLRGRHLGAASDILRYAIMDRFGGFYADVDTKNLAPLDEWFAKADIFVAHDNNEPLMSVPGHPFWEDIKKKIRQGYACQFKPGVGDGFLKAYKNWLGSTTGPYLVLRQRESCRDKMFGITKDEMKKYFSTTFEHSWFKTYPYLQDRRILHVQKKDDEVAKEIMDVIAEDMKTLPDVNLNKFYLLTLKDKGGLADMVVRGLVKHELWDRIRCLRWGKTCVSEGLVKEVLSGEHVPTIEDGWEKWPLEWMVDHGVRKGATVEEIVNWDDVRHVTQEDVGEILKQKGYGHWPITREPPVFRNDEKWEGSHAPTLDEQNVRNWLASALNLLCAIDVQPWQNFVKAELHSDLRVYYSGPESSPVVLTDFWMLINPWWEDLSELKDAFSINARGLKTIMPDICARLGKEHQENLDPRFIANALENMVIGMFVYHILTAILQKHCYKDDAVAAQAAALYVLKDRNLGGASLLQWLRDAYLFYAEPGYQEYFFQQYRLHVMPLGCRDAGQASGLFQKQAELFQQLMAMPLTANPEADLKSFIQAARSA